MRLPIIELLGSRSQACRKLPSKLVDMSTQAPELIVNHPYPSAAESKPIRNEEQFFVDRDHARFMFEAKPLEPEVMAKKASNIIWEKLYELKNIAKSKHGINIDIVISNDFGLLENFRFSRTLPNSNADLDGILEISPDFASLLADVSSPDLTKAKIFNSHFGSKVDAETFINDILKDISSVIGNNKKTSSVCIKFDDPKYGQNLRKKDRGEQLQLPAELKNILDKYLIEKKGIVDYATYKQNNNTCPRHTALENYSGQLLALVSRLKRNNQSTFDSKNDSFTFSVDKRDDYNSPTESFANKYHAAVAEYGEAMINEINELIGLQWDPWNIENLNLNLIGALDNYIAGDLQYITVSGTIQKSAQEKLIGLISMLPVMENKNLDFCGVKTFILDSKHEYLKPNENVLLKPISPNEYRLFISQEFYDTIMNPEFDPKKLKLFLQEMNQTFERNFGS